MGESMAKMGTGGILLLIGFLVGGMSERALADEHLEEHLEKHITEVLDAQIDPYIDSILNTFTEIVQSQQSNLIKSYIDMEKKVANNSQQVMNIEKKVANNSQQVMDLDNTKAEVEYVADLLKTVLELSKSMEAQIQDQEEHIKNVEAITASLASLNASFSDFNSSIDEWKLNSSSVFNNFTSGIKTKQSLLQQKIYHVLSEKKNLENDFSDLEKKVGNLTNQVSSMKIFPCQTTSGKPCIFPFRYNNKLYVKCTRDGNGNTPWCSTENRENLNYKSYGTCKQHCAN